MINVITLGIILVLVGSAIAYVIREKKKGVRCIGCPAAGSCCKCSSQCKAQVIRKCSGQCKAQVIRECRDVVFLLAESEHVAGSIKGSRRKREFKYNTDFNNNTGTGSFSCQEHS